MSTKSATQTTTKDPLTIQNEWDHLFVASAINWQLYGTVSREVSGKVAKQCKVFLKTFGGDPDAAYRIARCLRNAYEKVVIVIPGFCKSAGTLIAICADEIAIGDMGELGPLDIQVLNRTEGGMSSALNSTQALQTIRSESQCIFEYVVEMLSKNYGLSCPVATKLAVDYAAKIVAPLYAQVDPYRLGETSRNNKILKEYGRRLDMYSKSLKNGALDALVELYPSHGFVIDRKEAKMLFRNIREVAPDEIKKYEDIDFLQKEDCVRLCPSSNDTTPEPSCPAPLLTQPSNNEEA